MCFLYLFCVLKKVDVGDITMGLFKDEDPQCNIMTSCI